VPPIHYYDVIGIVFEMFDNSIRKMVLEPNVDSFDSNVIEAYFSAFIKKRIAVFVFQPFKNNGNLYFFINLVKEFYFVRGGMIENE
jgi:hypothetical protein